jgi:hypothetical protein
MTDYYGLLRGRLATSDALLGQVLTWLNDVSPGTRNSLMPATTSMHGGTVAPPPCWPTTTTTSSGGATRSSNGTPTTNRRRARLLEQHPCAQPYSRAGRGASFACQCKHVPASRHVARPRQWSTHARLSRAAVSLWLGG